MQTGATTFGTKFTLRFSSANEMSGFMVSPNTHPSLICQPWRVFKFVPKWYVSLHFWTKVKNAYLAAIWLKTFCDIQTLHA